MKIIKIQGETAFERGVSHGVQLKDEIHTLIDRTSPFSASNKKGYFREIGKKMLQISSVMDPIHEHTPWLLEEVKGIAKGAELDYETVLGYQNWYLTNMIVEKYNILENNKSSNSGLGCSVIGGIDLPNCGTILAQNLDQNPVFDGFQTLFHIAEPEHDIEITTLAYPGYLGLIGVNSKGVGLCYNDLNVYLESRIQGLPIVFLTRGLLAQHTFEEAKTFLLKQNMCMGEAVTIGDPNNVASFEVSANTIKQVIQDPSHSFVWHTNYPFISSDYNTEIKQHLQKFSQNSIEDIDSSEFDPRKKIMQLLSSDDAVNELEKSKIFGHLANSRARVETIKNYLLNHASPMSVDNFKEILSSTSHSIHHINMDPDENILCKLLEMKTNFSFVMELKHNPIMWVAPGPPQKIEYQRYTFENLKK